MMKKALIILPSIAVVLGIITFIVVFYGGGNYVVTNPDSNGSTFTSTLDASSTASSSLALASSTASSTASSSLSNPNTGGNTSGSSGSFSSDTSGPITWTEGNETMTVTGASYDGTNITLDVQIAMGSSTDCVPLNLRLIADENGDQDAPTTPGFSLPGSGTCEGAPGQVYGDQPVVFDTSGIPFPLLFTTGGASNMYFEVATTTYGGVTVSLPPTSG